jgi:hypothetical protein
MVRIIAISLLDPSMQDEADPAHAQAIRRPHELRE